ncbi:MAG: hypothetical protein J5779_00135, partial [Clostridia bacterium]|nr:hypothetical protein [Clostridia bacterium]
IKKVNLKIARSKNKISEFESILEYIKNLSEEDKALLVKTLNLAVECYEDSVKLKELDCKIEDLKNLKDENLSFKKFISSQNIDFDLNNFMPLIKFVKRYYNLISNKNLEIEKYINTCGNTKEIVKFYDEYNAKELNF